MKHPERVHSRSQLLDKVWGDHVFIEERTVDVHVKRLRESLGAAGADGRDRARRRLPPHRAGRRLTPRAGLSRARRRIIAAMPWRICSFPALPAGAARCVGWWLARRSRRAGGRWSPARWPGWCSTCCAAPRVLRWLRAATLADAPRDARALGRGGRPRAARCCARASSRRGDSRRSGCRSSWPRSRPRPTAWCCSTRRAASSGATRRRPSSSASTPQRDLLQHDRQPGARPGLRGLLRGRRLQRATSSIAGPRQHAGAAGAAVGAAASLRRRPQAAAVARHHRAGAGRGHAARFRRQRLARDPHAADGAGRLRRDPAEPAAATTTSARATWR